MHLLHARQEQLRPLEDCRSLWFYYSSVGAAIFFTIVFGMSTVLRFVQSVIYRKKFSWVIIMAGIWETAGFVLRTQSARNEIRLPFYMPEELLILLTPIWINVFAFMPSPA